MRARWDSTDHSKPLLFVEHSMAAVERSVGLVVYGRCHTKRRIGGAQFVSYKKKDLQPCPVDVSNDQKLS